jgi:DNA-binding MarR family transcriptional regulator
MALPLHDHLCFSLYSTSMAVSRRFKPMLDRMGITYPQFLVLLALGEEGGLTIGAIAERLFLESSTVTPPVKRMAKGGLVTRTRGSADERQVVVQLTDAGRALLKQSSNCLVNALTSRSGMSIEQIRLLNRRLQGLRQVLAHDQAKPRTAQGAR